MREKTPREGNAGMYMKVSLRHPSGDARKLANAVACGGKPSFTRCLTASPCPRVLLIPHSPLYRDRNSCNAPCKYLPHSAAKGISVNGTRTELAGSKKRNSNSIERPFCGKFSRSINLSSTNR